MVYTVRIDPNPEDKKWQTTQEDYQKQQINTAKTLNNYTLILAGISFATLVALVIYACISHGQLGAMQESNRISSDTLKSVQETDRPWVGIEDFGISKFEEGQPMTITVVFMNSGKRPAKVIATHIRAHNLKVLPENPTYELEATSTVFMVPQGRLKSQITSLVPIGLLNSMQAKGETFFIHGSVDYEDVRTNKTYWTHWCVNYMPQVPVVYFAKDAFLNCKTYNDGN